jgi:hypothetical protein
MQQPVESTLGLPQSAAPRAVAPFNWARFWIRSAVSVILFNVIAGVLTWVWIFPRLFPAR